MAGKSRITITRRHTGRYYIGLDPDSFAAFLRVVWEDGKMASLCDSLAKTEEAKEQPSDGLIRLRRAVRKELARLGAFPESPGATSWHCWKRHRRCSIASRPGALTILRRSTEQSDAWKGAC